jgi:hypothetical protein
MFSVNSIKQLVFPTETLYVYCQVGTEFLNIM